MDNDDLFAARDAARSRVRPADDDVPAWLLYPLRAIALIVVVPVRFVWELIGSAARLAGAALSWAGVYLVWLPLRWLALHLVWAPLRWLWRNLIVLPGRWMWQHVLRPPLRLAGRALRWLLAHLVLLPIAFVVVTLIYQPLRWLARALRPAASAVLHALRWTAGTLGTLVHRWVLRPAGWVLRVLADALDWAWRHSAVPLGRGLAWLWRHTVVPVARGVAVVWAHTVTPVWRFVRDDVWRPVATATRETLLALRGR